MILNILLTCLVWTTLITNTAYLPGLLTLHYSLQRSKTAYQFIALYTDAFPTEGHAALDARGIQKQRVEYLLPSMSKDYSNDPRFYDCWSKLTPFSLTRYERVVQLDSDMLVLQNMDELMDLELDSPDLKGQGNRVFAASHACVCNHLKKPHYPKNWVPEVCAFTSQHGDPDLAQIQGAPADTGLGMPNGGLQVVNPSKDVYDLILAQLNTKSVANYDFADQSLLSDVFFGRWVALPYIYNALKTMRWPDMHHNQIWRDDQVKNVHYILAPKPWDTSDASTEDTIKWWKTINAQRKEDEKAKGVEDEF
jgi:alpha-N-acetylglucosamine transferase